MIILILICFVQPNHNFILIKNHEFFWVQTKFKNISLKLEGLVPSPSTRSLSHEIFFTPILNNLCSMKTINHIKSGRYSIQVITSPELGPDLSGRRWAIWYYFSGYRLPFPISTWVVTWSRVKFWDLSLEVINLLDWNKYFNYLKINLQTIFSKFSQTKHSCFQILFKSVVLTSYDIFIWYIIVIY